MLVSLEKCVTGTAASLGLLTVRIGGVLSLELVSQLDASPTLVYISSLWSDWVQRKLGYEVTDEQSQSLVFDSFCSPRLQISLAFADWAA